MSELEQARLQPLIQLVLWHVCLLFCGAGDETQALTLQPLDATHAHKHTQSLTKKFHNSSKYPNNLIRIEKGHNF